MGEIIFLKLGFIKKIRLWWATYKLGVDSRLKYLDKQAREERDE